MALGLINLVECGLGCNRFAWYALNASMLQAQIITVGTVDWLQQPFVYQQNKYGVITYNEAAWVSDNLQVDYTTAVL